MSWLFLHPLCRCATPTSPQRICSAGDNDQISLVSAERSIQCLPGCPVSIGAALIGRRFGPCQVSLHLTPDTNGHIGGRAVIVCRCPLTSCIRQSS